jgi:signal transduction histidine kinase
VGLGILAAIALVRLHSYLLFHSLAELFSVVVACSVFVIFWNARRFLVNGPFLFLGIAYLFVGIVDLLHTLSYKGMGVFPDTGGDLPTQLWIAGRLLESGAFLAAATCIRRVPNGVLTLLGFAAATAILLASIFSWHAFPACYVEGSGLTAFKIGAEYAICLALAVSAVLFWRDRSRFAPGVVRLLVFSIAVTIAAEVMFTHYSGVYDSANLIGHLLKILSFLLIYKAMIEVSLRRPYDLLFRDLIQAERAAQEAQKRLAEQQRQAKELVEAELAKARDQLVRQTRLAAIGQIAASIAHDVRNPLAAMRFLTQLLKERVGPRHPEWTGYLDQIDAEIESTNRIVSNLMEMAYSKQSEKVPVDLDELFADVARQLGLQDWLHWNLELETRPMVVLADPVQLRQVAANLAANAAQAMGGHGEIRVRARRQGDCDVIEIEDDGPGVPAKIRDEIFEPLVTGKPKGTGLGLAICRQIIERHGGTIALCDHDGPGAKFQIRLPVTDLPCQPGGQSEHVASG